MALADFDPEGVLLFVAPSAREAFLWRELSNRLRTAEITTVTLEASSALSFAAKTSVGPAIAVTSWDRLIGMVEVEVAGDADVLANVHQLRALCDVADADAFIPFSAEEITNQRIPSLVIQVGTIIQQVAQKACSEDILHIGKLLAAAGWDRIGRYVKFPGPTGLKNGFGAYLGLDFDLWRRHGHTPLWAIFYAKQKYADWSRADDVRKIVEPWADGQKIFTTMEPNKFAVALTIPAGEEMDSIVISIVQQLRDISLLLAESKAT